MSDKDPRISRKVVVIEDEFLVRDHAVMLLEELGYEIVDFGTADEALAYLEGIGGLVSVVFTDVRMPGRHDGLALARTVREKWPWIALLVTSAERLSRTDALPDNTQFLPKPWLPVDVTSRVQQLIGDNA